MKAVMVSKTKQLFIGDICYALDNKIYDDVWGKKMHYKDGIIIDNNTIYAMAHSTKYGDGVYFDNNYKMFPVDAGNIGVVNLDYDSKDQTISGGLILNLDTEKVTVEEDFEDDYIFIKITDGNGKVVYNGRIDTEVERDGEEYEDYVNEELEEEGQI